MTTDQHDTRQAPDRGRRRLLVAALVTTLVVAAAVAALLLGGGGASDDATGAAETGAPRSEASAGVEPSPGAPPSDADETSPAAPPSAPPPTTVATRAPVPLQRRASFGDGVSARITDVRPVAGKGLGPGEISGPALLVTLRLGNGTTDPVDVSTSTVTLAYGQDDRPASTLYGDSRTRPLAGTVPPGGEQTAAYVFSVPERGRGRIEVTVAYAALSTVVAFAGDPVG